MGLDVHPLAVMMAKANLVIGLAKEIKAIDEEIYLPIYMADTLLVSDDPKAKSVQVLVSETEAFHIPQSAIDRNADLDKIIDRIATAAIRAKDEPTRRKIWKGLEASIFRGVSEDEVWFWRQNFGLFCKLIIEDRDTIWSYILKNAYRPTYIRKHKVDYVVGNPPWLAYRYIKDKTYRSEVKKLTFAYALLSTKEAKLFTHIDTSTVFFAHCEAAFLKPTGTIAFVMPKTTVLPAQQHLAFQCRGMSGIHDFSGVSPLFGVRSALLIRRSRDVNTSDIVRISYTGTLPVRNAPWSLARACLTRSKDTTSLQVEKRVYSPYYPLFLQGATIVPRSFWFVEPAKDAAIHKSAPYLETSADALVEAKTPWKIKHEGRVERQFLFETVLGKGLLPFAIAISEPVFLPILKKKETFALASVDILLESGFDHAAEWLANVEKSWKKLSYTAPH